MYGINSDVCKIIMPSIYMYTALTLKLSPVFCSIIFAVFISVGFEEVACSSSQCEHLLINSKMWPREG